MTIEPTQEGAGTSTFGIISPWLILSETTRLSSLSFISHLASLVEALNTEATKAGISG